MNHEVGAARSLPAGKLPRRRSLKMRHLFFASTAMLALGLYSGASNPLVLDAWESKPSKAFRDYQILLSVVGFLGICAALLSYVVGKSSAVVSLLAASIAFAYAYAAGYLDQSQPAPNPTSSELVFFILSAAVALLALVAGLLLEAARGRSAPQNFLLGLLLGWHPIGWLIFSTSSAAAGTVMRSAPARVTVAGVACVNACATPSRGSPEWEPVTARCSRTTSASVARTLPTSLPSVDDVTPVANSSSPPWC